MCIVGIPRGFDNVIFTHRTGNVEYPKCRSYHLHCYTSVNPNYLSLLYRQAYLQGKKEKPPFVKSSSPTSEAAEKMIPGELLCPLCKDIVTDAVVVSCCGNSYCDDCIRNTLLESEDHTCPTCGESDSSPEKLVPNMFLRTAVKNYLNETGYTKVKKPTKEQQQAEQAAAAAAPPQPAPSTSATYTDTPKPLDKSDPKPGN